MLRAGPDDDDTVEVRPKGTKPVVKNSSRRWIILAAGVFCLALAVGGAWFATRGPVPIVIDTETEAQVAAAQPCEIKVSYFALDPAIVIIDFPDLTVQGLMLDRVAALIEKARLPRDKVLDDVALREAIYNCGDTIEDYYYGHDYKAADLVRFFQLADAQGIKLNEQELWLRRLIMQLGWFKEGANGALITLPAVSGPITPDMRAVILHHELSHGAFYTVPDFARYAQSFWASLTPSDRARFTDFLGRQGYDTDNTNLMLNETQAYLIFTPDNRFFNGSVVGMSEAEIDTLRQGFISTMPNFWLQPMATERLPSGGAPAVCTRASN